MSDIIRNPPWPGPPFDPMERVRFRGRPLAELSREEAIEALRQALVELHRRDAPNLVEFETRRY